MTPGEYERCEDESVEEWVDRLRDNRPARSDVERYAQHERALDDARGELMDQRKAQEDEEDEDEEYRDEEEGTNGQLKA